MKWRAMSARPYQLDDFGFDDDLLMNIDLDKMVRERNNPTPPVVAPAPVREVGPDRHCSPRHRMAFNSINEG